MKNNKQGFTLIELLVVIAIIGILATGAVTVFSGAQAKARDAKRQSDVNNIASALSLYQADNAGLYPLVKVDLAKYLSQTPTPPTSDSPTAQGNYYIIKVDSNGQSFSATSCGMKGTTPEVRTAGLQTNTTSYTQAECETAATTVPTNVPGVANTTHAFLVY